MRKVSLFIIIFCAIAVFATADYFINIEPTIAVVRSASPTTQDLSDPYPNLTQNLLDQNTNQFSYNISKRDRSQQLFEKFDLSLLDNIRIYRNALALNGINTSIVIYEIQGPRNQGGLTYLNVKLKLIEQLDATEAINEVNDYGYNSFFYNSDTSPDNGFLLTQIKDNLFGFQYNKSIESNFTIIRNLIRALMDMTII